MANGFLQGTQQGGDQQSGDSAIDFSIGNPGVVALTEFVVKARVGNRVNQPRQQFTIIGGDITVVESH